MSVHLAYENTHSIAQRNPSNDDIGPFRRWIAAAAQQWQRHKMLTELRALDDRTLADIGLHRADIPRVVAGFSAQELGRDFLTVVTPEPTAPRAEKTFEDHGSYQKAA